ncbi:vitamin B12-dependent ribonucleotide reductase (plasmid) [Saccharopolyspora sp. ID03-671]|uniref:TSCPD domain-containing protein n=1 Tax=Saccharopolyspora sp. ID03-671 TaxID=3073066 RepID=UPI003245965A
MTIAEPARPMSVTPAVVRQHLPRKRPGMTIDVNIAGTDFKVLVAADGERVVDVHIAHSKHGTFGHGMLEVVGDLLTDALHYGMPIDEFVARNLNRRFEPQGWTDDPDIPFVASPIDYIARLMALEFLPRRRCVELGVISADAA